jgi:hypothetical protein
MNSAAATGMRLRDPNDRYSNLTTRLFPSPAAGRGNKLFLLLHVLVHVTSLVLSAAFVGIVGDHSQNNQIHADYLAAMLNLVFLALGIVSIIGISISSDDPFSRHGILLACMLWFFVAAFACLIFAFAGSASTLSNEHDARVIGLIAAIFQSWGLAFVFAGFVTGLSASTTVSAKRVVAEAMIETPNGQPTIFSA